MNKLTLELLKGNYGVCRLSPQEGIPTWSQQGEFYSITQTSEELSVVCLEDFVPEEVEIVEKAWRILKIVGPLDFSLIGILAKISELMADYQISVFAISTYNTDYTLVKQDKVDQAIKALKESGYNIIES